MRSELSKELARIAKKLDTIPDVVLYRNARAKAREVKIKC
jgi:hypothetical protein